MTGLGTAAFAQDDAVNFKVPRINEDGVVESVMTGDRARLRPGEPIAVEGMKILFFRPDGETVQMTVRSPACLYDPRKREAASEETIAIRGEGYRVDGKGYRYWMERERMEIYSDVRVRFRGEIGPPGRNRRESADERAENPESSS